MLGLIYKDLMVNKRNFLIMAMWELAVLPLQIIILSNAENNIDMLGKMVYIGSLALMYLVMMMFITSIFEVDESKKWAYFIASSPQLAKGQIKTKYLLTVVAYAFVAVVGLLEGLIVSYYGVSDSLIKYAVAPVAVAIAYNALEYPFVVRFGSKAGNYIRMTFIMILMFVLFVIMLFGDIEIFNNPAKFVEAVVRVANKLKGKGKLIACLGAVGSAVLYYISYRISCVLYLGGTENYDK